MKEIGEKLKEAREAIGITIEEASEDLKINSSQIEDIENGNIEAFSDIFNLKYFIRDYAKYLGLDKEDMIDDFNEYLFDYTSKISMDDIKKAKQEVEESKEKKEKIVSPYTASSDNKLLFPSYVLYILLSVLLVIIVAFIFIVINENNTDDGSNTISINNMNERYLI